MSIEKFSYKLNKDDDRRDLDKRKQEYDEEEKDKIKSEFENESNDDEDVPKGLINADQFTKMYGKEFESEIYEWYEKAITRRDREPLEEDRFLYHFFENGSFDRPYLYGDAIKKGYLLGFVKKGVFIPTHFAPKGLKGGYKIFEELGKGEIPTLLMITEDLAKSLSRIKGWVFEDIEIPAYFRGEDIKKKIAHNNLPKEKLAELARELLNQNEY